MAEETPEELVADLNSVDLKRAGDEWTKVVDFIKSVQSGDDLQLMIDQAGNDPEAFGRVLSLLQELDETAQRAYRIQESSVVSQS